MKFAVGLVVLSLLCLQSWANDQEENESSSGKLDKRIVNGRKARVNEFPWQVYLERSNQFICGGSIIRRDWILTAAHCVRQQPFANRYKVTVGAQARRGKVSPYKRTYRVKKLIYHHHYFRRHIRYDVALLQLDSSVRLSKGVQIISLPRRNTRVRIGQQCYVSGWGRLRGGGRFPNILRVAKIRIAHYNHCRKRNGPIVHDPTMVCAGAQGKGACNGDSGGPLACKENNRFVLRGVVSWGRRGCLTNHYSVFARVSSFLGWINKVTASGGCKKMKCLNGGVPYCQGRIPRCRCKPYYSGPRCGRRLCPAIPGGCFHGYVFCIDRSYSYCRCNRGCTGVNCEIKRTSCEPIFCHHGGSRRCRLFPGRIFYSDCRCRSGYAGRYCEYNKGWH